MSEYQKVKIDDTDDEQAPPGKLRYHNTSLYGKTATYSSSESSECSDNFERDDDRLIQYTLLLPLRVSRKRCLNWFKTVVCLQGFYVLMTSPMSCVAAKKIDFKGNKSSIHNICSYVTGCLVHTTSTLLGKLRRGSINNSMTHTHTHTSGYDGRQHSYHPDVGHLFGKAKRYSVFLSNNPSIGSNEGLCDFSQLLVECEVWAGKTKRVIKIVALNGTLQDLLPLFDVIDASSCRLYPLSTRITPTHVDHTHTHTHT
eukprot:GHVR01033343.1.p1 GENE.GHVR01033343.1~~GHVR01033343.1.p1  ORF type:complete len:256 (+),score=72.41 GHVR01033343.1:71-838(+)